MFFNIVLSFVSYSLFAPLSLNLLLFVHLSLLSFLLSFVNQSIHSGLIKTECIFMDVDFDLFIVFPFCLTSHMKDTILINVVNEFDFLTASRTRRHIIDPECSDLVIFFDSLRVTLQDFDFKEVLIIFSGTVLLIHLAWNRSVLLNDWLNYDFAIYLNISAKIQGNNISELHLTKAWIFRQHSCIYSCSLHYSFIWLYLLVYFLAFKKLFQSIDYARDSAATSNKNYFIDVTFLELCLIQCLFYWGKASIKDWLANFLEFIL